MTENREDLAAKKFKCSTKERAMFEAGIKMGTIYHQFVGVPVDHDSVNALEDAIEKGVLVQPYVEYINVKIDRSMLVSKKDEYSYCSLSGEMLDVVLVIRINDIRVKAEMRYDDILKYPLMYVSDVE